MTDLITIYITVAVYMNKIIYGLLGIPTVFPGLSPKCHLLITYSSKPLDASSFII